jgi:hypothetical protein
LRFSFRSHGSTTTTLSFRRDAVLPERNCSG